MAFSIMLWMPSWGGMINGIMTLSGAWDKLRTDPGLRFSVTAVGFYGMSTFEGPVMSVKQVNALSHYTDWGIGHVHSGALGWVAFIMLRRDVLPGAGAVGPQRRCIPPGWRPGTTGSPQWASSSTSSRCGSPGSWRA